MEKDFILTMSEGRSAIERENAKSVVKKMTRKMMMPVDWLGKYYSHVLEKPIGRSQTLRLIETQIAFALGVIPTECPLLLRGIFIGWFAWSVWKCKKAGI